MPARSIRCASACFVVLALIVAGCHTVPLGDPEKSVVDAKLNGWYQTDKPGTVVFIAPYDARTYIVTAFGYQGDAANPKADTKLTNKAWLTSVGGMDVMCLKVIDADWELQDPKEAAARYGYYRIVKTADGGIEATGLNTDFLKDTKTPDELAKKIADNVKNEELWKNSEPMNLKPVPAAKMDDIAKIVKAFAPAKA